jgi:hypothetical protein
MFRFEQTRDRIGKISGAIGQQQLPAVFDRQSFRPKGG